VLGVGGTLVVSTSSPPTRPTRRQGYTSLKGAHLARRILIARGFLWNARTCVPTPDLLFIIVSSSPVLFDYSQRATTCRNDSAPTYSRVAAKDMLPLDAAANSNVGGKGAGGRAEIDSTGCDGGDGDGDGGVDVDVGVDGVVVVGQSLPTP